jgi:hypothetical protein
MKLILLVLKKFLLVSQKIFDLLNGKYTYPEFEAELKELLNELGCEICTEVINEMEKKNI